MPIWRGATGVPSVGPEVHVKYEVFGKGDAYKSEATEAVESYARFVQMAFQKPTR